MISKTADYCLVVGGNGSALVATANIRRVALQKVIPCYQGSRETIEEYRKKLLVRRSKKNNPCRTTIQPVEKADKQAIKEPKSSLSTSF